MNFEHGDDPVFLLKELAEKENIRMATVNFLGALKNGDIVTGPKEVELPAKPNWTTIDNVWEVIGFGTISRDENSSVTLHLHGAFGKKKKALVGCLRRNSEVFITIEAVVTEFKGVEILRRVDPKTGHAVLDFNE